MYAAVWSFGFFSCALNPARLSKATRLLPNSDPIFTILSSSPSSLRRLRPVPNRPHPFNFKRNGSNFTYSTLGGQKDKRVPMEETGEDENFRFNRKRAQGFDKCDKPTRNLQLKVRKLNPTNTIAYVQILGTGMDTWDTSPSVLLFFDKQRFIFNAGEGLQRFCTEHKIKLSKIDHIFLSRVCSETAGGIPGLLLTLAGIGEQGLSVNIWGPSDLKYLVDAMKSFIPHSAMIHTTSFGSDIDALLNTNKLRDPIGLVEDELIKISAILVKPRSSEGSLIKPGDISVLYLCELPDINGKFDPEKAKALGLKPGPKYRELQSGKPVMSDDEKIMVHPSDVMGPSVPGPIVIIVDCPTEAHVQDLLCINLLNKYYTDFPRNPPEGIKTVNCVIHITPPPVSSSPTYHRWMMKFGSAQHIMAGHETKNLEIPILKSSARIATQLNYLCPQFFPTPGFQSRQHLFNLTPDLSLLSEGNFSELCKSKSAENLLKFTLRPHLQLGLDRSNIPSLISQTEVIDELLRKIPEVVDAAQHIRNFWHGHVGIEGDLTLKDSNIIVEEPRLEGNTLPSCLEDIQRDDLELVFLGTGSSQPSKYRNVTSIYINLFNRGGLLLDCGEGTLGQLKRRYGVEGADNVVRNLKGVWISHIHADHHTGLARILALRRDLLKDVAHKPVLVVGPRQLKRFLDAYQRLEDLDMQFIDCRSTTKDSWDAFDVDSVSNGDGKSTLFARGSRMQRICEIPGSRIDNGQELPALESLRSMLSEAGLDTLISFPVVHCPQAYGVALQAADRTNNAGKVIPGWKIAYSGDTRPCPELVEASHGATILIHEATFEDGLMDEALARNHSTTKEAIEVGEAAGAYRIILTHFSQRYPKVPVFNDEHMQKTCIAFDLMSVNIADLPVLPKVLPYLKLLFRNDFVDDESEDVEDAVAALP